MVALARTYTEEAIHGLAKIARDTKMAPAAARVIVWNSLLDRAWGKSIQPTLHAFDARSAAAPVDVDALTDEQRAVLEDILLPSGALQRSDTPLIEGETPAMRPVAIGRQ